MSKPAMDLDIDENDEDSIPSPNDTKSQAPTPSQRIAELNQIDHSISTLLTSASTATSILSNTNTSTSSPSSLSSAQNQFTQAAQLYFSTLSSIEVRLRRQVYALEEAGLIPVGDERDTRRGRTLNDEDGAVRRGGGGPLDPSWLNARASEGVEVGMRRDVLERGKELLAEIEKRKRMSGGEQKDVDMT